MDPEQMAYPLWVVECEFDGFVCTIWEKPGTGCSYITNCPACGDNQVTTTKVENFEQHKRAIERANAEAEV